VLIVLFYAFKINYILCIGNWYKITANCLLKFQGNYVYNLRNLEKFWCQKWEIFILKMEALLRTAHEKHACLNQNWKYAYFTRVKYELSSAHEKHGV
jgi:hypothetical protein